jgi:hypothetical protein
MAYGRLGNSDTAKGPMGFFPKKRQTTQGSKYGTSSGGSKKTDLQI